MSYGCIALPEWTCIFFEMFCMICSSTSEVFCIVIYFNPIMINMGAATLVKFLVMRIISEMETPLLPSQSLSSMPPRTCRVNGRIYRKSCAKKSNGPMEIKGRVMAGVFRLAQISMSRVRNRETGSMATYTSWNRRLKAIIGQMLCCWRFCNSVCRLIVFYMSLQTGKIKTRISHEDRILFSPNIVCTKMFQRTLPTYEAGIKSLQQATQRGNYRRHAIPL